MTEFPTTIRKVALVGTGDVLMCPYCRCTDARHTSSRLRLADTLHVFGAEQARDMVKRGHVVAAVRWQWVERTAIGDYLFY